MQVDDEKRWSWPHYTATMSARDRCSAVPRPSTTSPTRVFSSEPEVGARCVSSARRDLCGGRPVTGVPTATPGASGALNGGLRAPRLPRRPCPRPRRPDPAASRRLHPCGFGGVTAGRPDGSTLAVWVGRAEWSQPRRRGGPRSRFGFFGGGAGGIAFSFRSVGCGSRGLVAVHRGRGVCRREWSLASGLGVLLGVGGVDWVRAVC